MRKMLLLVLLILCNNVFSATALNEQQIFNRCYSQLTNKTLPLNHSLLKQIRNSKIKAHEACSSLLDSVKLDAKGMITKATSENLGIFKTLQALHSSWFDRYELNENTQDHPNSDIYDTNEMGYHFGWTLFKDGEHLKNTLERKFSFYGKRKSTEPAIYLLDKDIEGYRKPRATNEYHKWEYGADGSEGGPYLGTIVFWKPKLVEVGQLIGIQPFNNGANKIVKWFPGEKNIPIFVNRPLGGGILGTIPYIILNSGHLNMKSNGGDRLNRKFTTSIFKDLLCRNTPLLKKEDVLSHVDPKSKHQFRKKYECQLCHVTIDSMASAIRNVEVYNSGDVTLNYTIKNVFTHTPSIKPIKNFPDDNPDYYKSPPQGRVTFRDLYNNFIDVPVTSLQEIGEALSKTEDFHLCTASRYLSYFSGQQIDIEAINYRDKKENHPLENLTISLANSLKKHGSLKKLIKEILKSPFYTKTRLGEIDGE